MVFDIIRNQVGTEVMRTDNVLVVRYGTDLVAYDKSAVELWLEEVGDNNRVRVVSSTER